MIKKCWILCIRFENKLIMLYSFPSVQSEQRCVLEQSQQRFGWRWLRVNNCDAVNKEKASGGSWKRRCRKPDFFCLWSNMWSRIFGKREIGDLSQNLRKITPEIGDFRRYLVWVTRLERAATTGNPQSSAGSLRGTTTPPAQSARGALGHTFKAYQRKSERARQTQGLSCSFWSEWHDLNVRPLPPQGSALPTAPHPDAIPVFSWKQLFFRVPWYYITFL